MTNNESEQLDRLSKLLELQIEVAIASINDRVDCSEFAARLDRIKEERLDDKRPYYQRNDVMRRLLRAKDNEQPAANG